MIKVLIGMLVTCCSLGAAVFPAHAICGQTLWTRADQDLWNVHGCDTEFMNATKKQANLRSSDWSGRGWATDSCGDAKLEFPKFWNAWYLVTYGIQAIPPPPVCVPGQICFDLRERPWHDGSRDYLELVRGGADFIGPGPRWHSRVEYKPKDDMDDIGRYQKVTCPSTGFFLTDAFVDLGCGVADLFGLDFYKNIYLGCSVFDQAPSGDPPSMGATPGYRSAVYVHESWHAWNDVYNKLSSSGYGGHEVQGNDFCKQGACTACTQKACDHFRPHPHNSYEAGELRLAGQTGKSKIAVYQLQMEYACDVSDNAEKWVPYSVREDAANNAGWLAKNRFVERPPYWCGSTRPLWGARPVGSGKPQYCSDQNRRSCALGCLNGAICGNDGCCIEKCATGTTCSADYTCAGKYFFCNVADGCCYLSPI